MGSSNYPFGCCCSLTQGEFWGEDGDKEGATLINTPQQGEGWQLGRGEALCQGKTFPSGSALAFQVALSQGLLCSYPRGCSRFWPSCQAALVRLVRGEKCMLPLSCVASKICSVYASGLVHDMEELKPKNSFVCSIISVYLGCIPFQSTILVMHPCF